MNESKVLSVICWGWQYKGGNADLQLPQRPRNPSLSAGMRLPVPQLGQEIM
jgi:hypothetical protein